MCVGDWSSDVCSSDLLCILFTLGWAQVAARIATRASTLLLNRMTGAVLTVLGVVLIVINYC